MVNRLGVLIVILGLGHLPDACGDAIEKIAFQATDEITRADFYIYRPVAEPVAALVLAPGCNGNGRGLVAREEWQRFAESHQLALVGVSLASPRQYEGDRHGYYYAKRESGDLLCRAVKEGCGNDLPLLLYGFSGGAHFVSRFAAYKPGRVLGFCAYSAAWWDAPSGTDGQVPALLACGDEDGPRFGPALMHFKQGRAMGNRWCWVTLPHIGHHIPAGWEDFVRAYFAALLDSPADGCWVDIGTEEQLPSDHGVHPALTAWLPSDSLLQPWRKLHQH